MNIFFIAGIMSLCILQSLQSYTPTVYSKIKKVIHSKTRAGIYLKGSYIYEKRRRVHNGACANIYPDVIVVPKSTRDVSNIVSIARYYNVPISVRSGGHTYMCQSTKPGNNHSCRFIS